MVKHICERYGKFYIWQEIITVALHPVIVLFLFYFHGSFSGTRSLVTVHQPPVLTAALGNDVILPCQLEVSNDEKMLTPPVLYWVHLTQDKENPRLWTPSEKYDQRVELLEKNPNSSNKSVLLKNVQWADNGKYLCKLSITTERHKSFRRKGNETLLMVYGKYKALLFLLCNILLGGWGTNIRTG